MGPDLVSLLAAMISDAGGQIITSQLSFTPSSMVVRSRNSPREAVVPFIFQFPATRALGLPLNVTLIPPTKRTDT